MLTEITPPNPGEYEFVFNLYNACQREADGEIVELLLSQIFQHDELCRRLFVITDEALLQAYLTKETKDSQGERMDGPRPNYVQREQEARNLMIDLIAVEDAIRALESGQVNSFFVGGRTYSRLQLEELRRLRDSLRARAGQS